MKNTRNWKRYQRLATRTPAEPEAYGETYLAAWQATMSGADTSTDHEAHSAVWATFKGPARAMWDMTRIASNRRSKEARSR